MHRIGVIPHQPEIRCSRVHLHQSPDHSLPAAHGARPAHELATTATSSIVATAAASNENATPADDPAAAWSVLPFEVELLTPLLVMERTVGNVVKSLH